MARVEVVFLPREDACASSRSISMCIVALMLLGLPSAHSNKIYVDLEGRELVIVAGEISSFNLVQIGEYKKTLSMTIIVQHPDIAQVTPTKLSLPGSSSQDHSTTKIYLFSVQGKEPGLSEVSFEVTPEGYVNLYSVNFIVCVMISKALYIIASIMGWIYCIAWSISFYPQIYTNYKSKSVVGLNFDFLTLGIMGNITYSLFNCGLYFLRSIQEQYFELFPRGHNPVMLNDVFFSTHAAFATLVTIIQCFFYERGDQRVSYFALGILGVFFGIIIITCILSVVGVMMWLVFLYGCSCIKLTITFIKYLSQVYMNYKRKSTVGWSIGNILLDFTGGVFSILQMVVNAYNYDDWRSLFGNFTKFGLGVISLLFVMIFMLQHYVLYKYVQGFKDDSG